MSVYNPSMKPVRRSGSSTQRTYRGKHRFEHWYADNQVYFITARCRDRFKAFADERAKTIFWTQFNRYTQEFGFTPWVTSLIDNHYHTLGYLRRGDQLGTMMQRIHGSVAKLVNDTLDSGSGPSGNKRAIRIILMAASGMFCNAPVPIAIH